MACIVGVALCAGLGTTGLATAARAGVGVESASRADAPLPATAAARGGARKRARTGLRKLDASVGNRSKVLGKKAAARLHRLAKDAKGQFARGRTCRAVATLKRFISRARKVRGGRRGTAAAALGVRARELQRLVLVGAPRRTSCGLGAPKLRVRRGLEPAQASLGKGRPLARLVGSHGATTDFVENELLVQTGSKQALERFLKRWDGKLLGTTGAKNGPTVYLVRIKTSRARPGGLSADLQRIDPLSRGKLAVSSGDGLELLAAAADEAAKGVTIGVNWIAEGEQFIDRTATEGASTLGGWSANPFELGYMKAGTSLNIGVAEAWRDLEIARRLGNRVRIGVIDGGFAPSTDFSAASTGANGTQNNLQCGGSNPCPWHGTAVASTAAGVADNSFGVAGAAGPIGDLRMIQQGDGMWDHIDAVYDAFENGARVINMSFSTEVDAVASFSLIPFEDATQEAREQGSLPFAAAGNDGADVDAEDCFIACWEEEWHAPCENQGVICVGGLGAGSKWRDSGSNYGYEWCEKAPCDVDIFAPFTVFTGPDPDNTGIRMVGGTSFSSPFAAGIAALIFAANPSLSDDQVAHLLLLWAHGSPDKKVYHYVNPLSSVRHALPGNMPPFVNIDAPANGAHGGYGGLHAFNFKATAADIEDSNCCTVSWSSDKDGPLGVGTSIEHVFGTPGTRTVTATVTDSAGASSSDSVQVVAENTPPTVQIEEPTDGQDLARGAVHKFKGSSSDFNELGLALPCESLKWTTWRIVGFVRVDGPTGTGCQPELTFNANDTWTVQLEGTDSAGATASVTRSFDVVDPPAKPIATILQPNDGAILEPGTFYTLKGVASEPDGHPITYEWQVTSLNGTKTIGNAAQISWRASDDVPSTCGLTPFTLTLKATDQDGTGTDTIEGKVNYGPC